MTDDHDGCEWVSPESHKTVCVYVCVCRC